MQDDITHDNFDFRGFSVENRHETELRRDEEERSAKKKARAKAGKSGKADKPGKPGKVKSAKAKGGKDKAGKGGDVSVALPDKSADRAASDKRPLLFTPMQLRGLTIRNRIWLPPMDMYSAYARDGKPTPFHYQHYVSRALGGFGLIIVEATAVCPEGRISPKDVGLWSDDQIEAWRWIVQGVKDAGAAVAVQLNHAGRKGSTGCFGVGHDGESVPFDEDGWQTVAPSPNAYGSYAAPRELGVDEIHAIVGQFAAAAGRAVAAGFQAVEIHAAHGYLISQFLDPLVNERTDEYGGDLEGRMRFLIEIVDAVRSVIPEDMPLLVRISATDWAAGGWGLGQTVMVSRALKEHGVDLVDVSTGGIVPDVTIPVGPNYQVPFASQVRAHAAVPTTAVGLITKPKQAERILRDGAADAVEIGRAALRDPAWPMRAAHKLGVAPSDVPYPDQYIRGAY